MLTRFGCVRQVRWFAAAVEDPHAYIESMVNSHKVVLFMKGTSDSPQCGFSNFVVSLLKYYNIKDYTVVNVLEDNNVREEIKRYSDWPTIPQLYINQKFVGGCDILSDMHNKDELEALFKAEEVIK